MGKVGNKSYCSFPLVIKVWTTNHDSKVGDCIGKVLATNKQCKYYYRYSFISFYLFAWIVKWEFYTSVFDFSWYQIWGLSCLTG